MPRSNRLQPQRAPSVLDSYLGDICRIPLLSAEEERQLAQDTTEGDAQARDRLVEANLRLVVRIARAYADRGLPLADLISEGTLGLLRAVESYDPNRNIRFSTYASHWIKRSIRTALLETTRTVRVPAHAVRLLIRWRRAATELKAELHRNPTEEEVAARLGVKRKSVCIERASQLHNAGPQGVQEEPGASVEAVLADDKAKAPDVAMAEEEEVDRLMRLLGGLKERTALVVRLRFGLGGEAPLTLEEIGIRLGLTRERVHQIEKEALAELAEKL